MWTQVKMAIFLHVLPADGSFFVYMNILEYHRKHHWSCLVAEVETTEHTG